jgi:type 1 glutamine amidotransferase
MKVLALTGGHSFDREAFGRFLDALPCDVAWIEHPDAVKFVSDSDLDEFDVLLHYDMPGVRPPTMPSAEFAARIHERTETGRGFVVLHHAIASWPLWPAWAEIVGGQYLYAPGVVRGREWPDSGYRLDVTEHLSCVDPGHPVLAGLEGGLDLVDETYLCPVFDDEVTPLLRTDAPIDDSVHFSTVEGAAGRMFSREGWQHPRGSSLAAWTRTVGRSRVVYIQPGDAARTLDDPAYRKLVTNAVTWAAEPATPA